MKAKGIKCPICGTINEDEAQSCKMCKTHLSKKKNGKTGVKAPKSKGKVITIIDIEDPLTRKKLEELTLIPGVDRKKALLLYQSGIHNMEEFLQKAFHGERLSSNYSRTVANKLLVKSLKGRKGDAVEEIPCPSCNAPNPIGTERCNVCNFEIGKEMDSVNLKQLSGKLNEAVTAILSDLSKSEDFESLPDELKADLAAAVGSEEIDFDLEKPEATEDLGIDLDKIEEPLPEKPEGPEAKAEVEQHVGPMPEPEAESGPETIPEPEPEEPKADEPDPEPETPAEPETASEETAEEPAIEQEKPGEEPSMEAEETREEPKEQVEEPLEKPESPAPANQSATREKTIKILTEKMVQWRKAGYDVTGLEAHLQDVEGFKAKAKEVLTKGKVIREKCSKQVEMWRSKGFDVSELEPFLDKDIDEFMDKAKDVLKKQKR